MAPPAKRTSTRRSRARRNKNKGTHCRPSEGHGQPKRYVARNSQGRSRVTAIQRQKEAGGESAGPPRFMSRPTMNQTKYKNIATLKPSKTGRYKAPLVSMAEAAILTAYHNSLQTGRGPPTGRQFIGQRTPWRDPSPFESHPKGRWQLQVAARQSESTLRDNEKKSVETSKEKTGGAQSRMRRTLSRKRSTPTAFRTRRCSDADQFAPIPYTGRVYQR